MSSDSIRKQHQNEALAVLEDGEPLISRPSDAESDATLINPSSRQTSPKGLSPPRGGRRDSREKFKRMSMASSLGVGITSLTFTGSNVPTGDFSQGQYGCYDDFNVVNLRASQALGPPKTNSPKADIYSHPSSDNPRNSRNSYVSRRSYHEPTYRRSRASYMSPDGPMSSIPPVPPVMPRYANNRQPSYSANRPSYISSGSTNSTDPSPQMGRVDPSDQGARKRRFHSLLAKLAELLPHSRWIEKKLEVQDAQAPPPKPRIVVS